MSHLYVWAAKVKTAENGKSGPEEREMPGSHGFLYYRTRDPCSSRWEIHIPIAVCINAG